MREETKNSLCLHCRDNNCTALTTAFTINCSIKSAFQQTCNFPKVLSCFLFLFVIILSPTCTLQKRLHRTNDDPCYDSDGNARLCRPQFENIAFKKHVRVSETCGNPEPEAYCRLVANNGHINRVCDVCEMTGAKSHPASYLTDINDVGNLTYWQSKPQSNSRRRAVSLDISFRKKFEVAYISLQFFSSQPRAMTIFKSMDDQKTWTPYQYYARNCRARFGLPNRAFANLTNPQEVLCVQTNSSPFPLTGGRIIFNPRRGRPSSGDFENSYFLQDWVTASDIKIELTDVNDLNRMFSRSSDGSNMRRSITGRRSRSRRRKLLLASATTPKQTGSSFRENRGVVGDSTASTVYLSDRKRSRTSDTSAKSALTSLAQQSHVSNLFFAINDITIGGRCKCNGHASRCIEKGGRLVCDCKHNTAGVNCEKCKAFHYDRPWKRATSTNANECIPCNCNLHAKKCRLNADLFRKSGGVSGGVCLKCRHHTMGRHCHFCKPGYYKNNKTKSIAHRKICRPCGCHSVGAAGKMCDPATGQCLCKEGVAGKKCNRCAKGYEQTRSRISPCSRIPTALPPRTKPCSACKRSRSIRLPLKRFCKVDFVVEMRVMEQVSFGKWVRLTLDIIRVYLKRDGAKLRRGFLDVRIRIRYLNCRCPRLKKNRKYLLLGKYDQSGSEPKLAINKNSVALRWRAKYKKKIMTMLKRTHKPHSC